MKTIILALLLAVTAATAQTTPPSVTPQPQPGPAPITLVIPPDQVNIIVTGQPTAVLREELMRRCAVIQCTPIIVPVVVVDPPPKPPVTGFVGSVSATAGVVSGRVTAGTVSVQIYFDGSQVANAMTISAPDLTVTGTFTKQAPAGLHDGRPHEGTAYAVGPDGAVHKFDQVDGNGNTFAFAWK